jgi:hypothetical protein
MMTHDELLAEIDRLDLVLEDSYGIKALRAVVELHKPYLPEPKIYPNWITCKGCAKWQDDWADYPCPTIQAIEKELGL